MCLVVEKLAYRVVCNEILDEFFDGCIVFAFECFAFLGLEHDVHDAFNLCRRSGKTYLRRVGVDLGCAPFIQVEIGALFHEIL